MFILHISDDRIIATPKPAPNKKSPTPTNPDQANDDDEEEETKKSINRWYMGQYGDPDSKCHTGSYCTMPIKVHNVCVGLLLITRVEDY